MKTDRLSQVKECLEKGITKSADIATATGIHPSYVARLVKQANDPDRRVKGDKYKNASKIVKSSVKSFTFKAGEKTTGLSKVTANSYCIIKLNGMNVGFIQGGVITLKIHKTSQQLEKDALNPDSATQCKWMNARIKPTFPTMDEAKAWVKQNEERLQTDKKMILYLD